MSTKFLGSLDDLKAAVAATGQGGNWRDIEHGHQYRCENGAIAIWYPSTGTLSFQGAKEPREKFEILVGQALASNSGDDESGEVGKPSTAANFQLPKRVFVVHGHDEEAREQLELILHKLDLDPFVLINKGGSGLTIIEALEREIGPGDGRSRFGIVLMTPDDVGYSEAEGEEAAQPRARQNVVLEMGMLLSAFGRENVAILKRGHMEVPSDANGIIYLGFNKHVKEVVPRLVARLQESGFGLTPEKISEAST